MYTALQYGGIRRTIVNNSINIQRIGLRRWRSSLHDSNIGIISRSIDTPTNELNSTNNSNYSNYNQTIQNSSFYKQYLNISFNLLLKTSSSYTTFHNNNNNIIQWIKDNIPKGFDSFFPDDKTLKKNDESTKDKLPETDESIDSTKTNENDNTMNSKDTKNKKNNNKKKTTNNNNNENPNNPFDTNESVLGMLLLLGLVVAFRSLMDYEKSLYGSLGNEITFTEFRNYYLLNGNVDKIIVTNNNVAQVILKNNNMNTNNNNNNSMNSVAHLPGMIANTNNNNNNTIITDDEMTHYSSTNNNNNDINGIFNPNNTNNNNKTPYFYIGSVENLEEKLSKAQQNIHPQSWIEVQYVTRRNILVTALQYLPTIALASFFIYQYMKIGGAMSGGIGGSFSKSGSKGSGDKSGIGGIFSVGKSTHKKIKPEDVNVTFADVAGCDQAKLEIMEFVDFLKDSSRFTKLGAKIPKGALLSGPPGTGKTLLARATAGEAGVPFYSISGSDFIEMFVGVGPSRVRDLFKEARENAPCIVFIDEIDAVGRQRGKGGFSGGNDERENTLNQLLVEMDGFSPSTGVVVLAGTNRVDILDQALTRPGRFDRQVVVDKPDLQGRKEIFKVHLKGIKLAEEIDTYAGRLAGLTPGFAGADIANICNEAAIVAARRKGDSVSMEDFEKATDRIIGGLESNKIMSPEDRAIVAHHEAGHAIAGWFLEHADPLLKVTIIPRSSGALGFAQYLPKEVFLRSQDQIMDIVCMTLAGRAAEQVFFGRVTTGASSDLTRVTQLVYSTIKDFGMNEKVGQLAFPRDDNGNPFGGGGANPYSDSVAEAMDDEARSIVNAAYERTVALMEKHKDDVAKVANLLLEKETITHDDIYEIVGPRPFVHDTAYEEYVTSRGLIKRKDIDADKNDDEESDTTTEITKDGFTPGLV